MLALSIAIIIPIAVNSGAYKGDFTYAYNEYQNIKQADKSTGVATTFKTGTPTEVVDSQDAFISNVNYEVSYSVNISEAGEYSLYLSNHLLGSGFKDNEFAVSVDEQVVLSRGKIRAYFKNSSEEEKNRLAINGMSNYDRDSGIANSALVVSVVIAPLILLI